MKSVTALYRSLVIGADSTIGAALAKALRLKGRFVAETSRRELNNCIRLDLSRDDERRALPTDFDVAYLCAGITDCARCRHLPHEARAVNVDGTVAVARRLVTAGCRVIFLSTNRVFDGSIPFTPRTSEYFPHTEYGRTKVEAERQLRALGPLVSIVRFSQVWAAHRHLFQAWRELLLAGQAIHPLENMFLAPVPLPLAIETLCRLGDREAFPIVQLSAREDISYAAVAYRMAARLQVDVCLVQPRNTFEAEGGLEHVPRHTTLEVGAPESALGIHAPDPWQAIEDALSAGHGHP